MKKLLIKFWHWLRMENENGENCCKDRNIAKIKNRIKELEKEIEDAKQELAKLIA